MVSHAMKLKAERRLRQLLVEANIAQPDEVEYGSTFVRLIWHSVRKSIIVEVTEQGEVGESRPGPAPEPRAFRSVPPMATLEEKIGAERSGRTMLERAGLPQPDEVEYGYDCVRFFWTEQKVVVVIDIHEPPDGPETIAAEYLTDLEEDAA